MQCPVGDDAIRATNDDASECKRCAINLGYWQDKFINFFVKAGERKAPEINRGYYARCTAVGLLIEQFIKRVGEECQIINIGAGFDTLYWRLKSNGLLVKNFVEMDFPNVTAKKCYAIKRNKTLLEQIHSEDGEVKFSPTDLHSANYHLVGVDLRQLSNVQKKLVDSEIDWSVPTLLLAECVLVYVEPEHIRSLLSFLASQLASALFVNYEQVNMDDRFGQIMLSNLRARGCALAGVEACRDLASQQQRFLDTGWDGSKAWSMEEIWNMLPREDRNRIEKIEFLDETELLQQLFQHYCICIGWKDRGQESLSLADLRIDP
ncbi:leucine carboxyl methyltransferase 1 [Neocloeon triangulifer]|uniref:leucine carboxyl methyltransferase 1 n=1 Tax=Neocloeon triangulifer TaxID=2078957 RepID=UPI00286EE0A2|nr:leucine carboxyl methyltransferase 1 [Neocloeon triangulifer]